MRKDNLLRRVSNFGPDASFLANVILTHHARPVRKLKNLLWLLDNRHGCRTGQFDLAVLVVDGKQEPWSILDQGCAVCPKDWYFGLPDGKRYCPRHAVRR